MTTDLSQMDPHFMQIVLSLQAAAMQQMGKVMNPMTSKIERDLPMAQNSIDMLNMLNTKMKNNMTEQEANLLEHVLYELRLNYVDETKKKDTTNVSSAQSEPTAENTEKKENEEK